MVARPGAACRQASSAPRKRWTSATNRSGSPWWAACFGRAGPRPGRRATRRRARPCPWRTPRGSRHRASLQDRDPDAAREERRCRRPRRPRPTSRGRASGPPRRGSASPGRAGTPRTRPAVIPTTSAMNARMSSTRSPDASRPQVGDQTGPLERRAAARPGRSRTRRGGAGSSVSGAAPRRDPAPERVARPRRPGVR